MQKRKQLNFGQTIRQNRTQHGLSLRQFAEQVGLSATYVSQIETDKLPPPSTEWLAAMASVLEMPVDELLALAGRVPDDIPPIIQQQPLEMAEVIRAADGLSPAQLQRLARHARRLRRTG